MNEFFYEQMARDLIAERIKDAERTRPRPPRLARKQRTDPLPETVILNVPLKRRCFVLSLR